MTETVRAFCETHDLGVEAVPGVVRNVLSRLDPGAVVVDVDPESEAPTTEGLDERAQKFSCKPKTVASSQKLSPPPFSQLSSLETSFARLRGALHGYCAVYVDVYVTHLRL